MGGALTRMLGRAAAAAAATWQIMRAYPSGIGDDNGWHNYTLRLRFTAAALTDIAGATQVRIKITGPSTANGIKISKCYVGLEGGSNFAFNGSQVQLLFAGAANAVVPGSQGELVSDGVAIVIDGTAAIVVSFYFTNDASFDTLRKCSPSNSASAYKLGDDAATTAATGYTTTAQLQDTRMEIDVLA